MFTIIFVVTLFAIFAGALAFADIANSIDHRRAAKGSGLSIEPSR